MTPSVQIRDNLQCCCCRCQSLCTCAADTWSHYDLWVQADTTQQQCVSHALHQLAHCTSMLQVLIKTGRSSHTHSCTNIPRSNQLHLDMPGLHPTCSTSTANTLTYNSDPHFKNLPATLPASTMTGTLRQIPFHSCIGHLLVQDTAN